MNKSILVTGGAGYIGSHACLALLETGHAVSVVDNLSNSHREALRRVESICNRSLTFHPVDLCDRDALTAVFASAGPFDAVIHFAGLKAVGESVAQPLRYFHNNLMGSITLFELMDAHDCRKLVFSSSATVYGHPDQVPIPETAPLRVTNPYGRTKLMIEEMLADLQAADSRWRIARLRYFNPVGAHPSGHIGEDPNGIPNNLLPYIAQVAVGRRPWLNVYGNDYPTADGTGVRDYIHVLDLVEGHLRALDALDRPDTPGLATLNLGTGKGYSVLDMVAAFERASGRQIETRIAPRRPGDAAVCYADPTLAYKQLNGWKAVRDLNAMCADTWRWQQQNPEGYPTTQSP